MASKKTQPAYDCLKCPAYCCTYEEIPVSAYDIKRLARGLDLTSQQVEQRFTKNGSDGTRVLRHRQDGIFPTACTFLDQETRRCTVYEHRPKICREFPSTHRCGYYDFMNWEREQQEDDEFVPVVS